MSNTTISFSFKYYLPVCSTSTNPQCSINQTSPISVGPISITVPSYNTNDKIADYLTILNQKCSDKLKSITDPWTFYLIVIAIYPNLLSDYIEINFTATTDNKLVCKVIWKYINLARPTGISNINLIEEISVSLAGDLKFSSTPLVLKVNNIKTTTQTSNVFQEKIADSPLFTSTDNGTGNGSGNGSGNGTGDDDKSGGLSTGAIIGIVVGIIFGILFLIGVGIGIWYLTKNNNKSKDISKEESIEEE